jgi:hypothetical protein
MAKGHFPAKLVAGMEQVKVKPGVTCRQSMFHVTPPKMVYKFDVVHLVSAFEKSQS